MQDRQTAHGLHARDDDDDAGAPALLNATSPDFTTTEVLAPSACPPQAHKLLLLQQAHDILLHEGGVFR